MKIHYALVGLLVVLAVCAAGCTQGGSTGTPTAKPTAVASGTATGMATVATTGVATVVSTATAAAAGTLDALPAGQDLAIQVNKDPIDREVTVIFNGGRGQGAVTAMEATITRSDGTSETKPLQPRLSAEAVFKGTKGTDKISVKATLTNGKTYRFFEQSIT
jgi:hypothetical protein